MKLDIADFKQKLEEEKTHVEQQLSGVARKNPENPEDWEPKFTIDANQQAPDEIADKFEEMGNTMAIEAALEERLNKINEALSKITASTYGICSICGKEIPTERLGADPAATTCANH
jgi:RNA polymerase-binding transcription factor DksA